MKKSFYYRIVSREFVISFIILIAMMLVYSFLRFGFYIANHSFFESSKNYSVIYAFLGGLQFDLAAIVMINIPVLVLFNLPLKVNNRKAYRYFTGIPFFIINIAAIGLNIADYGYFPTLERRLLYEPYTMLPDIIRMVPGLITYHYVLFGSLIAGSSLFVYIVIKVYRVSLSRLNFQYGYIARIFSLIFITLLSVIAIRGGLQMKPLRVANAFTNENISIGYLKLNTTYTVVRSYFQPQLPELRFLSDDEANTTLHEMLQAKDEVFTDTSFPFQRTKSPAGSFNKMNVVIFIMESWSATYVNGITGEKSRTPFFDSLAAGGLLFTNFFASGQRSIEGIPAILASLPAIYNTSLIGSVAESNRYRGLGSILSEAGYNTSFHHGGITGTMGFDAFSKIAGFNKYYGKESFPNLTEELTDGSWGVCDEPFFLQTKKVLSETSEPFCAAIFSLSSHDPYKIPDNRLSLFDKFKDEPDYEQAVRYSDYSLGEFFRAAQKEPWFGNTLFVITADHTLFNSRNSFYSTYHSPLLLFAPGLVPAGKNDKLASHTDILPTILDILHIPTQHSSMGTTLLDSTKEKYAFVKYAAYYGVISNQYVLIDDLEHLPMLYDYHKDPMLQKDLREELKSTAGDMNKKLYSYLQSSTYAIAKDKVYKERK